MSGANDFFTRDKWSPEAEGALVVDTSNLPVLTAGTFVPLMMDKNTCQILTSSSGGGGGGGGSSTVTLLAGSAIAGKFGIDQTTPGTTNAVSVGSSISSLPAILQLPTALGAKTTANSMAVNIASDQVLNVNLQSSAQTVVSLSNSSQTVAVGNYSTGRLQVSAVSGTINVSASVDGTNFVALLGSGNSNTPPVSTISSQGAWQFDISSYSQIKFQTTGTATGSFEMSGVGGTVTVDNLPFGQNTMANSIPITIASNQSTLTVTSAAIGSTGSAIPTSVMLVGLKDGSGNAQPISSANPVPDNVAQFGGSAVVTGTGASGSGIPRVTISNDSSLAANQSVNVSQFGGSNSVTGTGAGGAGIPRVTVSNDSTVGLVAGAAIIGKVGIDQTTVGTTNAVSLAQIGSTTVVNGGVAGTLAIGGNIAVGTGPTANPIPLAIDSLGLTRRILVNEVGGFTGPEELQYNGFTFTAGASTPVEGTSCRTFNSFYGVNCHIFFGVSAQGNAASTMQVEGSFDGQTYNVIPLSRTDSFSSGQLMSYSTGATSTSFAPASNTAYRGKTYGYPIIRFHQTAFTTTGNTISAIRIAPIAITPGEIASAFTLDSQNTTEAIGTGPGVLMSGGVRTLPIISKGAAKVILELDAFTYATAAPTSSTLVVEGFQGGAWTALSLLSLSGGTSLVTSITGVGALPGANNNSWYCGRWEADCTGMTQVRVRWSAYTAGSATNARYHGALRVVPMPNTMSQRATYTYTQTGLTPTTSTNIVAIEAGASKATKITRLIINPGTATANGWATLTLNRETAAGTTNSVTVSSTFNLDPGDANFSGVVRSSGLTNGTMAAQTFQIIVPTPISTTTSPAAPIVVDLENSPHLKPIVIPAGTANGAVFVHSGLSGAANFGLTVEWTEE